MNYCLVVATFVASGCWAAMIPSLMFARPLSSSQHHQQQQQYWRPKPDIMDRHHPASMLMQPVERPVYGVAHRYLSDPAPAYYDPAEDLYNSPIFRPWANKRSYPAAAYYPSSYDLMDEEEPAPVEMEEPNINQQDVINFEKYVQRYFQLQQQQDPQEWTDEETNYDDEQQIDNDEEAARQLHLLLNQQRRPAVREIKKKSVSEEEVKETAAATTTTTPAAPTTVTTTATTTSAPSKSFQGQKEEPMLRPPTSSRPTTETSTPTSPTAAPSAEVKEDSDIYKTIQRLMAMRNQLQQQVTQKDDLLAVAILS